MDDAKAIEQCKAGDDEAFGYLVKRYQAEAIGHALAILHHREDALDAVQDAFVRAFRSLGTFDCRREFYPWFYTILRHRCFHVLQERSQSPTLGHDVAQILAPSSPLGQDSTEIIEAALQELSGEDRELITLKHLDGFGYEELGRRLGIPAGTAMSRLYYARLRLREKVQRIQRQCMKEGKDHD